MKKVVIYTADNCPNCSVVKRYFEEKGISFEQKNVREPEYRKELMAFKLMCVPVVKIDEEVIVGFNPIKMEEALNK